MQCRVCEMTTSSEYAAQACACTPRPDWTGWGRVDRAQALRLWLLLGALWLMNGLDLTLTLQAPYRYSPLLR